MARKKEIDAASVAAESNDSFFEKLAKKTSGNILDEVGSKIFFDTGNLALNYVCSGKFIDGGIPDGVTEIFGPSSSAKSLLGLTLIGQIQSSGGIGVLLDVERSANKDFAIKAGHVNPKQLLLYTPRYMEEIEQKITMVVREVRESFKDKPILFVWDSIGATMTKREWSELELPENYTEAQYKSIVGRKQSPGERARAAGDLLRKINPFLSENNASMFVINQTRTAIGEYNDETTAGGGKALPFYANCRLRSSAHKKLEDKNKFPIGVNLKFMNKKSRSFVPFISIENVPLFYNLGINPLGGLLGLLLMCGRIEVSGRGYYQPVEAYSDGKSEPFQASKERNDISPEILMKYPKLIDAKNENQVKQYLNKFEEAIKYTYSDSVVAIDNNDEEESDKDFIADIKQNDE